ncbi:hypothetical protein [Vibrio sp. ER1A]|uniref:hypothetical protein n=1 Tax=Vibrio sp. ER1A TaxID=1517681 RepID=UPI0004DD1381|nr:hypothetical protein [Vibrio sp. ER1A]KFA99457.1 hypothetical protein HW45_03600 [Vibrio sp. ER1A]
MFDIYLKTGLIYALCVVIFYIALLVHNQYRLKIGPNKSENLFVGVVLLGICLAGGLITDKEPILWLFIAGAVVSAATLFLMWRKYTKSIL